MAKYYACVCALLAPGCHAAANASDQRTATDIQDITTKEEFT